MQIFVTVLCKKHDLNPDWLKQKAYILLKRKFKNKVELKI